MPQCKGFSASVRATGNGNVLEEYAVDPKDDSVTSWIASEEGKNFFVTCKLQSNVADNHYCADLEVDGIPISRKYLHQQGERHWYGKRTSESECRLFTFSRVKLVDESQLLRASPSRSLTRSIIIRIRRVEKRKEERSERRTNSERNGDRLKLRDLDTNIDVCEKEKEMNPHGISFVPVKRGPRREREKHKYIDSKESPFFTFKFLYGPANFLRAEGVIPQEKGQSQENAFSDENQEVSAVLQDLERLRDEAERQKAFLQNEIDKIRATGKPVVKTEATPVFFTPGEVIALTDD